MAGSPDINLDHYGMFSFYVPPADLFRMASDYGFLSDGFNIEKHAKGTPSDPDVSPPGNDQWHLTGTWGTHADQVWNDYTGTGILVAAIDDGFQHTHHEITANYRTDLDLDTLGGDNDAAPGQASDNHGTSVLGTIIADDNGSGGVGVAFDAEGTGIRIGFNAQGNFQQIMDAFTHAHTIDADVVNNSWGSSTPFADTNQIDFLGDDYVDLENLYETMVQDGRGGLGQNIVFSAGNTRAAGDNANYHNIGNSEYVISVAAIAETGIFNGFSNPGANVLVAAGGSGVYTTDRTGGDGYSAGDYTNFSGTSAAAPIVSGVVALILEANPDLGYRDVQEILAYSAQHNDSGSAGWQYNGANNWNGGGLHFSHDYGFGAADVFTAVRLAEHWHTQQTFANMTKIAPISSSPALNIPATGTVTTTINVAQDIEIERVIIEMDLSHTRPGDLIITLISPDGTESVLVDRVSNGSMTLDPYGNAGIDFEFTSVAHWGESSQGLWTLEIQDVAGGNSGTLNDWSVEFSGNAHSNDDVYIFTNDYGNFAGAALAARNTIVDADGGTDIVNLTAVTSNSTLNLTTKTGTIAGQAVTIGGATTIEEVYAGDGADTLTGSASDDTLYGGRGNDLLEGMGGDDTIDGEAGDDTVTYAAAIANFAFNIIDAVTIEINDIVTTLGNDVVRNVENFIFNGDAYTRAQLEDYINNPPAGTTDVSLSLSWNGHTYVHTSSDGDNSALSSLDMGTGYSPLPAVGVTNNGGVVNLTILNAYGPRTLRIDGGDNDDVINVQSHAPQKIALVEFYGGLGDDTINLTHRVSATELHGGGGNDTITGQIYTNDVIYGDDGDDIISGGGLKDTLYGGAGNDTINGDDDVDTMYGGDGDDIMNGGTGNDEIYGDDGNDTINGGANHDLIYGGAGNDMIDGGAESDTIYGDDGNDIIIGGLQRDTLYGGAGNDLIDGGDDVDVIYGDAGMDIIAGGANNDLIYGGDDDDLIDGGDGNDRIYGDAGNDIISDSSGTNIIYGGTGNDTITGSHAGNDIYGEAGNDFIAGGNGLDRLHGGDDDDTIMGFNGINYLYGGAGGDIITGGTDRDFIYGEDGDDQITSNAGRDEINAGDGDDTVSSGADDDRVYGGLGNDVITAGDGRDYVYGEDGNDDISGEGGNDYIYGGDGNDTISGGDDRDFLYGGIGGDAISGDAGDDLVYGEDDNDSLDGGAGNDILDGGNGDDTANGGDGNDQLLGRDGNDILNGDAGDDYMYGHAGNDTLNGGAGSDYLYGDIGNDTLNGGDDNDRLYGDDGDDIIDGGAGIDTIYGGDGNDDISGGDGNDFISAGDGVDMIDGGAGSDYIYGGNGNDIIDGGDDADRIYGDADDDDINGGGGDDLVFAGTGNDTIDGGAGNDRLYGDAGDDLLIGGDGLDQLYGGAGADQFGFTVMDGAADLVWDFNASFGDTVNITDLLTGFTPASDINEFVSLQTSGGTQFHIDADGGGDNFQHAFTVYGPGFYGQTAQDLLDNDILIVDETLL